MEEKSRFQKALDIFRPSQRGNEEKLQSNYNQLYGNDASIFGYNTSSGFVESNKLKEIGSAILSPSIPKNISKMVIKRLNINFRFKTACSLS